MSLKAVAGRWPPVVAVADTRGAHDFTPQDPLQLRGGEVRGDDQAARLFLKTNI